MNSNLTLCVGTLFDEINDAECLISRIIGTIIILVSIFSIIFNIRFIYWSSYHRHVRSRHYSLIISMIFSSISVIIVISPSIFIQCLSCTRLCSPYYCRFEGFVSYLNGCVHMFMLMMISIIRYSTVFQTNIRKRYFEQHSLLTVIICWLFGLVFALPPLFNWNRYMPEGIGFHCGLNWFDRSISSRIYFILTFTFVYFVPLIVLFVINVYVYYVIRRLLYGAITMRKPDMNINLSEFKPQSTSFTLSSGEGSLRTTKQSVKSGFSNQSHSINGTSRLVVRRAADSFHMNHLRRLNRLKVDRRFALAIIFLVSEYLLSWTPYAIVALLYLLDINFISPQSVLMTICAFIAKVSMILNPFIYIATIKTNHLTSILYCNKCSCSSCRIKRNMVAL